MNFRNSHFSMSNQVQTKVESKNLSSNKSPMINNCVPSFKTSGLHNWQNSRGETGKLDNLKIIWALFAFARMF